MAELDIRQEVREVTELRWCENRALNLSCYPVQQGMRPRINVPGLSSLDLEGVKRLQQVLQKSIDLGWVK